MKADIIMMGVGEKYLQHYGLLPRDAPRGMHGPGLELEPSFGSNLRHQGHGGGRHIQDYGGRSMTLSDPYGYEHDMYPGMMETPRRRPQGRHGRRRRQSPQSGDEESDDSPPPRRRPGRRRREEESESDEEPTLSGDDSDDSAPPRRPQNRRGGGPPPRNEGRRNRRDISDDEDSDTPSPPRNLEEPPPRAARDRVRDDNQRRAPRTGQTNIHAIPGGLRVEDIEEDDDEVAIPTHAPTKGLVRGWEGGWRENRDRKKGEEKQTQETKKTPRNRE